MKNQVHVALLLVAAPANSIIIKSGGCSNWLKKNKAVGNIYYACGIVCTYAPLPYLYLWASSRCKKLFFSLT
jgi:hypothetical protein